MSSPLMRISFCFTLLVFLLSPVHAASSYDDSIPKMDTWLQEHADDHVSRLVDFLSIQSVSADPSRASEIRRAADWVLSELAEIGLENGQILEAGGHPAVYADWLYAGTSAPTVLLYGHYDVQPEDPVEKWTSSPFKATIRGDHIFARGASDDKGNMYAVIAALRAIRRVKGDFPVNIKIFFEGEEEIGSPSLPKLMATHRELLRSDMVFSADGGQIDEKTPGLCLGLRGAIALEVFVRTANTDVHSGTYGGGIQNPIHALTNIIDGLRDPQTGRVLVKGFYDDVDEISATTREQLAKFPRSAEDMLSAAGANQSIGLEGLSFYERTWLRPSLEVVGIKGGFQGVGIKTVIPREASAKLSVRTAGRQDSETMIRNLEAHVKKLGLDIQGAEVGVERIPMLAEAYSSSDDGIGSSAATAVLEKLYERDVSRFRMGGSIPALGLAARELKAEIVMFAFGLADENVHAPDEFFRLSSMRRAERAYVRVLGEIASRWATRDKKEEL